MADKITTPKQGTPVGTPGDEATPEQPAAPITPPKPEPTIDELKAQIKAMVDANNFGAEFGALSKKLATAQAKIEADQREATQKALVEVTAKVQAAIEKATEPFLKEIEAKGGDGIWFVSDWGELLTDTRLIKKRPTAAKKSGGSGGGGGRKVNISTDELMKDHGDKAYKDTGMTYQEAHNSDTNGNKRYAIRQALLKEAGLV